MNFIYGILLSGGNGSRFGGDKPKQFTELAAKPLIVHSVNQFQKWGLCKSLIIVAGKDYLEQTEQVLADVLQPGDIIIEGGQTRHESTLNGIAACKHDSNDVLIFHDVARPFVSQRELEAVVYAALQAGVSSVARKNNDTLVEQENERVTAIVNRESTRSIQTPQALHTSILATLNKQNPQQATDLTTWALAAGLAADLVESNPYNIKITHPQDLNIAKAYYQYFQKLAE